MKKMLVWGATVLLSGCGLMGSTPNGVQYFCVVPPPAGSTLAKVNGYVALTDKMMQSQWCRATTQSSGALCTQACQAGDFSTVSGTGCQSVKAIESSTSEFVVWQSDLNAGRNLCAKGTVVGPGTPGCKPGVAGCPADTQYSCLYTNSPSQCDSSVEATSPALGTESFGFDNYIATASASAATAKVTSDEDSSKTGVATIMPGYRSLSFNVGSAGLKVSSLVAPIEDFSVDGNAFTRGNVTLIGARATASPTAQSATYAIPTGAAKFSLVALDSSAKQYSLTATNSTPITLAIGDPSGPSISGTVAGSLNGHPVHADLNLGMVWLNRPPIAVARATNVQFDSSTWPGAKDHREVCLTSHGPMGWTWHGVASAKTLVTLDGSGSYDPDPGDGLIYAWNLATPSGSPNAYLRLGPGNYNALLTVQDQYLVSVVASVAFTVVDVAQKRPTDCGGQIVSYNPANIIRHLDLGDPAPFESVSLSHSVSAGQGIAVNAQNRGQIEEAAQRLGKETATRFLERSAQRNLGASGREGERLDRDVRLSPANLGLAATQADVQVQ